MARTESPPLDNPSRFHEWLENDAVPALFRRVRVQHSFGSAVDTPERVRHGLDSVPEGFIVVDADRACIVYRASDAPKADSRYIWLECNTASAVVTLLIF
jgi:hypothetical protein